MIEAPLSEKNIRQYLLGELSEQEQVEIEDRAFEDQRVLEQILAVEQDLIDDYVSGDIPEERRHGFSKTLSCLSRAKKEDCLCESTSRRL